VPAVLSVSTDTFILVTSNVFAILGLRALYFVLAQMILKFRYLEPAMALLLVTIGAKMLLHDVFKVPNVASLVAILGIVTAGILASIVVDRARPAE
jgi:tellurite resistance protein TerC